MAETFMTNVGDATYWGAHRSSLGHAEVSALIPLPQTPGEACARFCAATRLLTAVAVLAGTDHAVIGEQVVESLGSTTTGVP